MTGLTIPYVADKDPFAGLANWSIEFPFEVQGVKYPSVNHYIFSKMTNHSDNATLLSCRNDADLREKFNDLSDRLYHKYTKQIISDGTQLQFLQNKFFRSIILDTPNIYFYYISDNVLWGINSNGYGYNLIGQAYARLTNATHSSFYVLNVDTVYRIYRANVLLVHHLQMGNDVQSFIGTPIDGIISALTSLYTSKIFLRSDVVFENYKKDPFFQNIQYEIDYPWNLAGFVRKQYAQQINYYLRLRFNQFMISKYFAYVLKKRFAKDIDMSQIQFYVQKQMARLTEQKFQDMSDMLYRMYNDPSTSEKTFVFLENEDIQQLYDIEIQFLSTQEMNDASRYVPFLYQIKVNRSIYVYDVSDNTNIEPYTTGLSPLYTYTFHSQEFEYDNLLQYLYVKLTQTMTNLPLDKTYSLYRQPSQNISMFQDHLAKTIETYKIVLMRRGMSLKFNANLFSKYLLYNSNEFAYDMTIQDPDAIFQTYTTRILLDIRKDITQSYFSVSYSLLGNKIYLQDRIRYRMEDYQNVFDAYRIFQNKREIDMNDFQILENRLYRDPKIPKKWKPVHPQFYEYFHDTCSHTVIEELWHRFVTYAILLLSPEMTHVQSLEEKDRPRLDSLCAIISYFVKTFFDGQNDKKFYDFVLTVLLGKTYEFDESIAYYSTEMERCLQNYLEVDTYNPEFIVNVMGMVGIAMNNISIARHRYFSYWALPMHTPPFPSHLASKMSATAMIGRIVEEEQKSKRRGRRRTRIMEEEEGGVVEQQEELQQMDVEEMLRDLGLEDDEAEEVGDEDYESDMETHYGNDM